MTDKIPTFDLNADEVCAPDLLRAIAHWKMEDYDLATYYARKAFNQHPETIANLSDQTTQDLLNLATKMETHHRETTIQKQREIT